ncbi:MAG TPA: type I-E CRISPR-associated protein Cse1/CasA, partial [Candidatus Gastranaerophilaceae bacterium]|nr:type I-E CRISPR-associated protein Cse1/CasA [Candidatus Gastranaerophilaceae bacterium]
MTNIEKFNLVDESWIPTVGSPLKSLRQVFTEPQTEMIAGSPIQKIALLKLLLAIAQSAYTPRDDEDWRARGVKGMAEHCLPYLDQWRRKFWLYGPEPFLQMPDIKNSAKKEK